VEIGYGGEQYDLTVPRANGNLRGQTGVRHGH